MKTLNRVQLLGSVGSDPEIKTPNGNVLASFSLATTERIKDKSGNWIGSTEWHALVAFGHTAEVIRDYVKKGSSIHVEGRLRTQSWDDKASGQKRYKTQIVVQNLILLGSKSQREDAMPTWNEIGARAAVEDDIPF